METIVTRVICHAGGESGLALENVLRTVKGIAAESDVLRGMRDAGAIEIAGAMYDISTGGVKFLDC